MQKKLKVTKLVKSLLFSFLFTIQISAQDVQFSQLFADRLYLNPAYAGVDYCPRISLNYRNQWPGVNQPYVTYSASYDRYLPEISGGIGIHIMNDRQGNGVFNQLNADFIYAFYAQLSQKSLLRFAFQASVFQKSVNANNLVYANMIDPVQGIVSSNLETFSAESFISPDFTVALLYNYKRIFFGVSGSHLPFSLIDGHSEYLPLKLTAHAGMAIPLDFKDKKQANLVLEPNIAYINQQDMNMLYYGMYFGFNDIVIGMFYRQNLKFHFDAAVMSCHLNIKRLIIGYSYDIQLSKNIGQTMGTHEVSLGYQFNCSEKIRNYNTISCPSF